MAQCTHVNRSGPLVPGHKAGGVSLGRCQNEALEDFTVCFEHATKEALFMLIQSLRGELVRADMTRVERESA